MTLTDAGPLVALLDAGEDAHEQCRLTLATIRVPLVTTWPVFTEAMYLLARAGGQRGTNALWRLALSPRLEVSDLSPAVIARSAALMSKYADVPMDLADATLVALAEERNERRVFTLDSDFQIYRSPGRSRFEIVPA